MSRRAMTSWMLVGTGIGIAAAVLGSKNMKNKRAFRSSMNGLKSQTMSMKDDLAESAADMAKKTGSVLMKAGKNLDDSVNS